MTTKTKTIELEDINGRKVLLDSGTLVASLANSGPEDQAGQAMLQYAYATSPRTGADAFHVTSTTLNSARLALFSSEDNSNTEPDLLQVLPYFGEFERPLKAETLYLPVAGRHQGLEVCALHDMRYREEMEAWLSGSSTTHKPTSRRGRWDFTEFTVVRRVLVHEDGKSRLHPWFPSDPLRIDPSAARLWAMWLASYITELDRDGTAHVDYSDPRIRMLRSEGIDPCASIHSYVSFTAARDGRPVGAMVRGDLGALRACFGESPHVKVFLLNDYSTLSYVSGHPAQVPVSCLTVWQEDDIEQDAGWNSTWLHVSLNAGWARMDGRITTDRIRGLVERRFCGSLFDGRHGPS